MTANRKMTGRAVSLPSGLTIGAFVSMATTILISAVSAHLVSTETLAQEHIGYCSIAALICSTLLGASAAAGKIKRQRLMVCLLSGLVYYLLLISMTALFFGGQYQGMGVTLVVVALASGAAALLSGREGKRTNTARRKKTHR